MKVAEFLLGFIPLLIQLYADLYRETDFESTMLELESEFNVPKIKTYDFIIVGGGSAGCLLAGRLSEFFNVLLLEAGGIPPPVITEAPLLRTQPVPNIENEATGCSGCCTPEAQQHALLTCICTPICEALCSACCLMCHG